MFYGIINIVAVNMQHVQRSACEEDKKERLFAQHCT
jgi:hypothetical protein